MAQPEAYLPAVLLALVAGGCGQGESTAEAGRALDCALAGKADFAADCRVENASADGRRLFVARHPDGGFRRFEAVDDGRGVVPADGVETARARWAADGLLEVAVGADRYRFPARMRPDNAAQP